MENDILTVKEAAAYLQMGKKSLYKLIRQGNFPHKKVLNKFRFVKSDLRDWIKGSK